MEGVAHEVGEVVTDPSGRGYWATTTGAGFPRSYLADPPRGVPRSRYVEIEFDEEDVTFRSAHGHCRVRRYQVIREVPAAEIEAMRRRRIDEQRLTLIGGAPRFADEAAEIRARLGDVGDITADA